MSEEAKPKGTLTQPVNTSDGYELWDASGDLEVIDSVRSKAVCALDALLKEGELGDAKVANKTKNLLDIFKKTVDARKACVLLLVQAHPTQVSEGKQPFVPDLGRLA